jgi:hypothetical protein
MGGDSSRVAGDETSTIPLQKLGISHDRQGSGISPQIRNITPSFAHKTLLGQRRRKNEIVFQHVFPSGHEATRQLLQRLRTEAHAAIGKRLGMDPLYTDAQGDTVTVDTKNWVMETGPPQGTLGSASQAPERRRQRTSSGEINIKLETLRQSVS